MGIVVTGVLEDQMNSREVSPSRRDGLTNRRKGSVSKDGLPPQMKFSRAASYNNPHEMFPSASKLFAGNKTDDSLRCCCWRSVIRDGYFALF